MQSCFVCGSRLLGGCLLAASSWVNGPGGALTTSRSASGACWKVRPGRPGVLVSTKRWRCCCPAPAIMRSGVGVGETPTSLLYQQTVIGAWGCDRHN